MYDILYSKIGEKIKLFAMITCIIEALACIVAGVVLWIKISDLYYVSLIIMIVGPLFAWIKSLFVFAIGDTVDNLWFIERHTALTYNIVKQSDNGYSEIYASNNANQSSNN
ncbi:MAG: hypothetical protein IKM46_08400 [Clostridia bacterium]|nr:hypothetical protein [Clostridia bacterium]